MNLIDPRTAIVLACCMSGLMSLIFFSLRRRYPSTIGGLGEWSASMLALFGGGVLFAGYGVFPPFFSTLAIMLMLSGLCIGYVGTQRFFGLAPRVTRYVILLAILLGALSWFSLVDPDPLVRLRIANAAMTSVFIAHAYLIYRQPARTFASLFTTGVLAMMALIQIMRFATSFMAPEYTDVLDTSLQNLVYIISYAFGAMLFSTSAALLVPERVLVELEAHRQNLEQLVQERTAALMDTEARASRILESAADGLYGLDRDGRVTFINPAGCRMLGYEVK